MKDDSYSQELIKVTAKELEYTRKYIKENTERDSTARALNELPLRLIERLLQQTTDLEQRIKKLESQEKP